MVHNPNHSKVITETYENPLETTIVYFLDKTIHVATLTTYHRGIVTVDFNSNLLDIFSLMSWCPEERTINIGTTKNGLRLSVVEHAGENFFERDFTSFNKKFFGVDTKDFIFER